MFQDVVYFPKGGRLEIKEYSSGHYIYRYLEPKERRWIKRRRWEWHKEYKERPHIHYYDDKGRLKEPPDDKKFTKKYDIRMVLEEIKKDFDDSVNVVKYVRMIKDRD